MFYEHVGNNYLDGIIVFCFITTFLFDCYRSLSECHLKGHYSEVISDSQFFPGNRGREFLFLSVVGL